MKNALQSGLKAAILLGLLSMLGTTSIYAQGSEAPLLRAREAHEDDIPLLRTTTRLVQLNVVVLDKGRPVDGLTQGYFEVFDNGVPQRIVHFSVSTGSAAAEAVKRSPLVIGNRAGSGEGSQGVTVILVDEFILDARLGMPLEYAAQIRRVRLEVMSFLSTLRPGQQVALYALRREGVVVIHDFTDDSAALADAAKSLGGGGPRGKTQILDRPAFGGGRTLTSWRQNAPAGRAPQQNQAGEDAGELLAGFGFQAIIQHLAGVPGRKNLVWISVSLPKTVTGFNMASMLNARDENLASERTPGAVPHHPDPQGHFNEILRMARMFSNANVAVYPVDASGLTPGGPVSPVGRVSGLGGLDGSDPFQRAAADTIAEETGGQVDFDSNRLDQHLTEIVAEGNSSYQIGYYPGDAAWDGNFHHIKLKLTPERKGYTLLARKGYYAVDAPPAPNADAPLREAAHGVVEAPAIGVTLNVSSNPLEWGPEDVVVKLDFQDIHFDQIEDRSKAKLDLAFVQLGKDGGILEGVKDRIELGLLPKTYSDGEKEGWYYTRKLWVAGNAEKLRVVVRDLSTGAVGSVSVPVHTDRRAR